MGGHRYRPQVRAKLQEVVMGRRLDGMYPPQRLERLADQIVNTVNFDTIAQQWRLPVEVALDLSSIALYDVVIYADDSGSMKGERWNSDLKAIVHRAAGIGTLFDTDGISVRFMNHHQDRDNIRTEADVMALLSQVQPSGRTPIGTSLRKKLVDPYLQILRNSGPDRTRLKPLMVITVTDGAPQGEAHDTLVQTILHGRSMLQSMAFVGDEIAYQFAQVGDDAEAQRFLDSIDNHPQVGQFVDATSNFEREADQWARRSGGASQMTPDLYLLKLLVGAIDNSWDSRDDQAYRPPPQYGRY